MAEETSKTEDSISIKVPKVSGDEAAEAIDLVEHLVDKYGITPVDADALFNGIVAIFVRQRAVHGDRRPAACPFGQSADDEKN